MSRAIIPTFYDMGAAGFWRDMLANSPWLKVHEHDDARRASPDPPGASDPFHITPSSPEPQHDHA